MSDLRIRPAAFTPQAPHANPAPVDTRSDAWLREFERARWQAQPHYERGAAPAATDDQAGAEQQAGALPAAPSRHASTDVAAGTPEAAERQAATPFTQEVPREQGAAAHGPSTPAAALAAAPAPTRPVIGDAITDAIADAEANEAPAPHTRAAPGDVQWSARTVHVHAGEQCTSVWIRDARLSPQDAVRLLERLRPLAGPALDPGADLRLTVNGRPVDRNPQR
jgi:hypothetical protein